MSCPTFTGPRNTGHTYCGPCNLRGYEVHLEATEDNPAQILCVSGGGQIMSRYQKEARQLLSGRECWDEESNLGTLVGELTTENRRFPSPKHPYEINVGELVTILDYQQNPSKKFKVGAVIETTYIGY